MAARNSVKDYRENSFYHIYNRGVNKQVIYPLIEDAQTFLLYLKTYLTPKDELSLTGLLTSDKSNPKEKDRALKLLKLKNFSEQLDLVAYVLMPNHFHLLVRQKNSVINSFMNALGTRFGMYINRKYKRVGPLFQGVYKAVLVESEEYLLHLSRYIHLNPFRSNQLTPSDWEKAPLPFSLPEYLGKRRTSWVKPQYVTSYFGKTNPQKSYFEFLATSHDTAEINTLALDISDPD